MGYEVSTAVFAGPLDLLLALINAQQVELWEVSVAEVVNGYLGAAGDVVDLEVATEVALVAATLIALKCRRLLPGPDDPDTDEEQSWEDRDLLLTRMLECQTFAQAGRCLGDLAASAALSFPRTAGLEERLVALAPDLLAGVSPVDLLGCYLRASAPRPVAHVEVSHLTPPMRSVDEVVSSLIDELPGLGRTTFRHLTRNARTRQDVVVVFLAVLELFKQGVIELDQIQTFGELHVAWRTPVLVGAGAP
jgi:segregation and condensation protein A